MSPHDEGLEESGVIIDEIESNLANILTKKRQTVEREFQERVRKEKEESDRKISELEEEFSHDKGLLGHFRSTITEYDRAKQGIQSEVQSRLDKAVRYQKEIERLTSLTMEELNKVDELSGRLGELRRASEVRAAELRARIQQRFGLILSDNESAKPAAAAEPPAPRSPAPAAVPDHPAVWETPDVVSAPAGPEIPAAKPPHDFEPHAAAAVAEPPAPRRPEPTAAPERPASERRAAEERIAAFRSPEPEQEIVPDLEIELRKLKRIKQLLENDGKPEAEPRRNAGLTDPVLGRQLNPELPPLPEEPAGSAAEPSTYPEPAADMKMPEINQIIEDFAKRPPEPVPLRPEPIAPRPADRPAPKNGLSFQAVFEMLEQYRKTEALDEANEISYFQKGGRTILDGESILRSMGQVYDSAKKVSGRLGHAESAKDQFFLKQELLNQQEVLRRIILRGVKLCENESAVLPAFTAGVMNVPALRGILEHLTQGNWSNAESLAAFEAELARLKESFYRQITPPAHYLRSILDELNG